MPLSVLNVDLADVLAQPDRNSELITTLAWGDAVEVEEVTAGYVRISTVRFEKKPDGSIVPAPAAGYICPPKSSGIKTANLFIPREQRQPTRSRPFRRSPIRYQHFGHGKSPFCPFWFSFSSFAFL